MNIRQRIARWLGYGAIEWPRSQIDNFYVRIVSPLEAEEICDSVDFLQVQCYSGGVQIIKNEIGCMAGYRYVLDERTEEE